MLIVLVLLIIVILMVGEYCKPVNKETSFVIPYEDEPPYIVPNVKIKRNKIKVSNTVESVVARFLKNKHMQQFIVDNNLTIEQAAVVYFRRSTAYKRSYAPYLPVTSIKELWEHNGTPWWGIPVDPNKVAKIRSTTLAKYRIIIAECLLDRLRVHYRNWRLSCLAGRVG